MIKVLIPTAQSIVELNKFLCQEGGNPHLCVDQGKIESALHSAFYPGSHPFIAGGITKVAAALCFYLVKSHAFVEGNKRTGALAAIIFMNMHGWDLSYSIDEENDQNALAQVIEACAAGQISKEQLMDWFEAHKVNYED